MPVLSNPTNDIKADDNAKITELIELQFCTLKSEPGIT